MKLTIISHLFLLSFGVTNVYANTTATSPGALMLSQEAANVVTNTPSTNLPKTGELSSFFLSLIGVLVVVYVLSQKKHVLKKLFLFLALLLFARPIIVISQTSGAFINFLPLPPSEVPIDELTILRTPYFYFDVPMQDEANFLSFYGIAENRKDFIAEKNVGTPLTQESSMSNYVMISDVRHGEHDWNLTVRKEGPFIKDSNTAIVGAQIILSDIWIAAMRVGQDSRVDKHLIPGSVTIIEKEESFVVRGSSGEGHNVWAVMFGYSAEAANNEITSQDARDTLTALGQTFKGSILENSATAERIQDLYFDTLEHELQYNSAIHLKIPLGQMNEIEDGVFKTQFTWILSEVP